jgi:hypothetical protein
MPALRIRIMSTTLSPARSAGVPPRNKTFRNFPSMPPSRSNEREFSHWNPCHEQFGAVFCCPTGSGIRTGGTIVARQIHAALRNLDVPLGGKLPCDPGKRNRCYWIVTAASRCAADWLSVRAPGGAGATDRRFTSKHLQQLTSPDLRQRRSCFQGHLDYGSTQA